ncbi:MAG TPA: uroporphyrinogen decarboxylase family protein [Aggregatilineaceae bacterium]|nr:uroporphyrinogen decarboxylase family protein [Aggregatilineaceae bacterium]
MNPRERLQRALNHQEPDRVPMDLGATRNSGITMPAYRRLVESLGLALETQPLGTTGNSRVLGVAAIDERVLERLGVDVRGVFLGPPDNWADIELPDNAFQDQWGVVWKRPPTSLYFDPVRFPLAGEISLHDVVRYPWPDVAGDAGYTRGLRDRALWLHERTEYGIVLHLQDICVHYSQWLRGYEDWYTDFHLNPGVLTAIMDAVLERRMAVAESAIAAVGDIVDVISCSDDVADQRGPMVSPDSYRKFIKPRHRRFFDMVHSRSDAKVLFHSDGSLPKLLPDFIEIGIDFINPVQVSAAGMDDTARLKREFGRDIGFWGAIDNVRVLPYGTPDDVRAEVQRRIRDLGPGGGYVLGAVHNIQPDVPPENIVALFDSARAY